MTQLGQHSCTGTRDLTVTDECSLSWGVCFCRAWLFTDASNISKILAVRSEDATGLECRQSAESYQIGNYGMGGHYEPHQDSDPVRKYKPIYY